MALSKATRIKIMVVICGVFFLVEIISGYYIDSLALIADAFHMLNDIISLCVGHWAVVVANSPTSDRYSYGWVRAEIVGGFFNAVFLLALCVSIGIEAVTRFFQPPEIKDARIMLIVGCLGLASNMVGFLILGGHGHSHGPEEKDDGHRHDHEHAHENEALLAEEGRSNGLVTAADIGSEGGRAFDVLPQAVLGRASSSTSDVRPRHSGESEGRYIGTPSRGRQRRRTAHHTRLTSIDDQNMHPSSFRQEILAASRSQTKYDAAGSDSETEDDDAVEETPTERTALLQAGHKHNHGATKSGLRHRRESEALHMNHNHNKPKEDGSKKGHSHSHHDMGMRAMILHVIGDALGNAGVIATALVIWFVQWPGKHYFDPAVSLFITAIILHTAWPITRQTGKVLLQATPEHIDLKEIREDIQALPGVVSCHHVHIWQLSDTKLVASLHIQVAFPISEEGGERYMELAKRARKCLHAYGIHSATIQPEFCTDKSHNVHGESLLALGMDGVADGAAGIASGREHACLLECVDDCVGKGCCPPLSREPSEMDPVGSSRSSLRSQNGQHYCGINTLKDASP